MDVTPEAERRFIGIVRSFAVEFDKLLRTPDSRVALAGMAGTEVVVRRAVDRALASGRLEPAWGLADSLRAFLQLTGRGGEGATLMMRLDRQMGSAEGEISETAARVAMQSASARAAANPEAAVGDLKRLLDQLDRVRGWDTRAERAHTLRALGQVHVNVQRRPAQAIEPVQQAIDLFAELEADGKAGTTNRAAMLGDLANALRALGRFDQARRAANDSLELNRQRNDRSAVARAESRIAQILAAQGRHVEAEQKYRAALATAEQAGDAEISGSLWQGLGDLALADNRPDDAVEPLTKALTAFQRAGHEQYQMMVLSALGEVERGRGNPDAALSWYQRSLEIAERLGNVQGKVVARGSRAIVLYDRHAQAAADPETRRRLLNEAIAEQRESLALQKQLGTPASIAIIHNNLAESLRRAGQLDEAEQHARQALAIFEQLNDARMPSTLHILQDIATARGDTTAADEYRRRKLAAMAEAERRARPQGLPLELVVGVLQVTLTARARQTNLADALASANVDNPAELMDAIERNASWLAAHIKALAAGAPRPAAEVPPQFAEIIQQFWDAAGG